MVVSNEGRRVPEEALVSNSGKFVLQSPDKMRKTIDGASPGKGGLSTVKHKKKVLSKPVDFTGLE